MLQLKINCESTDEARMYLNARQYLNLITDLTETLRSVLKHNGTDAEIAKTVKAFMHSLYNCVDHNTGPY